MRWILIAVVLIVLHSMQSIFGLFIGEWLWLVTLGLLVYFGIAIGELKKSQGALQQDLKRLEKMLRTGQVAAKPMPQTAQSEPEIFGQADGVSPSAFIQPVSPEAEQSINQSGWLDEPLAKPSQTTTVNSTAKVLNAEIGTASVRLEKSNTSYSPVKPAIVQPSAFEQWLVGGNWIVRGGLAILFLGLVFLSKFAYDNNMLPIELRLAGVAAMGLALLTVGWRSRAARPAYGLSLQGGGIAAIYLTVFASVKLAGLLPMPVAFGLMLLVGVLAAWLAIKQDAMVLAVIGSIGGFMTPLLLSTGQGSHIGLFSYYAALNAGVMTVALRKAWRPLNLLAFFFTYGVALLWGLDKYQPDFLLSCLGFLLLFFVQFVTITGLFTRHQTDAGEFNRALDASLLFGVPTASFGYAFYILKPFEYGGAIAAVLFSAVYCSLAFAARQQPNLNSLKAPWSALGLLFATIAVPLVFDARLTSAAWALEGAAVIWYSWQQAALKTRWFGYLLVLAGSYGFITHWPSLEHTLPILNASSLGLLSLALAYGVVGVAGNRVNLNASAAELSEEATLVSWLAAIALALAVAVMIVTELYGRQSWFNAGLLAPALLWLWALGLQWLGQRFDWPQTTAPAVVVPILTLMLPIMAWWSAQDGFYNANSMLGIVGLVGLLVWQAVALQKLLPDLKAHASLAEVLPLILMLPGLSVVAFWWLMLVRGRNTWSAALNPEAGLSMHGWYVPLATALPVALVWWLSQREHTQQPLSSPRLWQWLHGNEALPELSLTKQIRGFVMILLVYVSATSLLHKGGLPDIPYLPVMNLYELVAIGSLLTLFRALRYTDLSAPAVKQSRTKWLSVLGFIFANSILSRILANFYGAEFELGFAWHSAIAAATYSIVWTLAALVAMWWASRQGWRGIWIVGASLLGIVAIKLLLIDLEQVGTLARIVSFIGVGVLMLVVGYVAPIPIAGEFPPETKASTQKHHSL